MTWRIQRFKDLVTPNKNLCFQVYASFVKKEFTEAEFDAIAAKHNIDLSTDTIFDIPRRGAAGKLFMPQYLFRVNGTQRGMVGDIQPIFTSKPDYHYDDMSEGAAIQMMKGIVTPYLPQIKNRYPDLVFQYSFDGHSDAHGVQFRYLIGNYDPQVCHPQNVGKLMPLTVMGDVPLYPEKSQNMELLPK